MENWIASERLVLYVHMFVKKCSLKALFILILLDSWTTIITPLRTFPNVFLTIYKFDLEIIVMRGALWIIAYSWCLSEFSSNIENVVNVNLLFRRSKSNLIRSACLIILLFQYGDYCYIIEYCKRGRGNLILYWASKYAARLLAHGIMPLTDAKFQGSELFYAPLVK